MTARAANLRIESCRSSKTAVLEGNTDENIVDIELLELLHVVVAVLDEAFEVLQ